MWRPGQYSIERTCSEMSTQIIEFKYRARTKPMATVREVMERLLETPPLPSALQALSIRRANAAYEASPCSAIDRSDAIAQMILAHAPTLPQNDGASDLVEPPDVDPFVHPIRIQLPKHLFPGVHASLRARSRPQAAITGRVDASLNVRILGSAADGARFEARRQPTRAFRATTVNADDRGTIAIGASIETVLVPMAKGRSKMKTHTCGFAPPTRDIANEFSYLAPSARKRALEVATSAPEAAGISSQPPRSRTHDDDRADAIRQEAFAFRDLFGDDDDDDDPHLVPPAPAVGAFPLPQIPHVSLSWNDPAPSSSSSSS